MPKEVLEFARTDQFMKYAASSCGVPAELHGKQETMRPGADITLELPQPNAASAFCRVKIPPIVVRVARLCISKNDQAAEMASPNTDRVFEGEAVKSLHPAIREGDTVIGMASAGCDVLVVNADNPEDMRYLRETYDDEHCMQHVAL